MGTYAGTLPGTGTWRMCSPSDFQQYGAQEKEGEGESSVLEGSSVLCVCVWGGGAWGPGCQRGSMAIECQ